MHDHVATFGEQLRQFRVRAGLSQAALAERANLSSSAVTTLERGVRSAPYLRTVEVLAQALGLSAAERAALITAAHPSPRPALSGLPDQPVAQAPQLPVWLTSFVGRDAEVGAVRALLDPAGSAVRLLTLVGPGGVGKTRLAVAVAAGLPPAYPDGVVFVDLAPLHDARLAPATIARAVGLREGGARSARDLLLDCLRERRALLVLDNFEHLLEATPLVPELLQRCPRVALLVTSRRTLHVQGEQRFAVAPLATPSAETDTAAASGASPAVRLFVERAQLVATEFVLSASTASAVANICRRLDGLPLAIELAAARTPLLPPEALLRRLERRLPLLTSGAQDLPRRQQTLRATLAWSRDLLRPGEQVLFRRLAVFAGGWKLEAAEAVCGGAGLAAEDVLESLGVLVDASLVRRLDEAADEPRFGMLETIREYALEQLEAVGEAAAIAQRHLAWCLALAESVRPLEPSADQIERLAEEQSNLRAALRWSIQAGEVQMALRLGVALYPLWYTRGLYTEGRAWLAELLALPSAAAPAAVRAKALAWAGHLASAQGMLSEADGLLREGLSTAQQVGDALAQAICSLTLGSLARLRGMLPEAEVLYQQSLAFARRAENPVQAAWAAYLIAFVRYELGDADGVRTALTEAIQRSAADTYPRVKARILRLNAWLAALAGDHIAALAFEEQSLALLHRLGDQQGLAFGNLEAARRALERGDWPQAARHLSATLTIGRSTGEQLALAQGLEGVAHFVATVAPERAVQLLGTAAMVRKRYGFVRTPLDQAWLDSWLTGARHHLAEAAYVTAWEDGQRDTLEHAVELALVWADGADRSAPQHD